jgi:hypothetical protein
MPPPVRCSGLLCYLLFGLARGVPGAPVRDTWTEKTSAQISKPRTVGPPIKMTRPAPIFAPITPAVITLHPAPTMRFSQQG